jgi:hypothetical protein
VRGQTSQAFRWLVFFDVATPSPFRQRADSLAEWAACRPCFVSDLSRIREVALEHVDAGTTHLITTRLDNDDALSREFIGRVQNLFDDQQFEIVNFPRGFRLDLLRERLYAHSIRTNPFITLIERAAEAKTILGCGSHARIASRFDCVRDVETPPLWLQVIHDRNLARTGLWGCRRVPLEGLDESFALRYRPSARRERRLALRLENVRRGIERQAMRFLDPELRARVRNRLARR